MSENTKEMNMIEKPIIVAKEEFTIGLYNLINGSELPLVIVQPVLEMVLNQVNTELKNEMNQYVNAVQDLMKDDMDIVEDMNGDENDRETIPEEDGKDSTEE